MTRCLLEHMAYKKRRKELGMFMTRSLVGDHAVVFWLFNGKVQRRKSQTLLRDVQ